MSTQKKSLISKRNAVKKANSKNAKPSVSAPISGNVKPRVQIPAARHAGKVTFNPF